MIPALKHPYTVGNIGKGYGKDPGYHIRKQRIIIQKFQEDNVAYDAHHCCQSPENHIEKTFLEYIVIILFHKPVPPGWEGRGSDPPEGV
jgi:hypothetical protein